MGISPKTVIGPCKLLLKRRSQRHCPNLYTVRLAWGTAWSWYGHGVWTSVSLKSHKAVSKQSIVSPLENREFLERNRSYVTPFFRIMFPFSYPKSQGLPRSTTTYRISSLRLTHNYGVASVACAFHSIA